MLVFKLKIALKKCLCYLTFNTFGGILKINFKLKKINLMEEKDLFYMRESEPYS